MKKILFTFSILLACLTATPGPVFAQPNILDYQNVETTNPYKQPYAQWRAANVADWNIATFDVEIGIEKTRDMMVKETIVADFTGSPHHGIIRFIPIRYQTNLGANLNLDFELLGIENDKGVKWPYEIDTWLSDSNFGQNAWLKIGDADTLVTNFQTYVITYKVKNAVTFWNDYDELYWNVTGTNWDVPIYLASLKIKPPSEITDTKAQSTCYTGYYGSQNQNCVHGFENGDFFFETYGPLAAYEGLTAVSGFPKGIVAAPTQSEKFWRFTKDNWLMLLPILTFVFMVRHWRKYGRDADDRAVVPQYKAPEGLTPLQAGALIDEKVHPHDITATIIDLAIRGYVKIEEIREEDSVVEKGLKALGFNSSRADDYRIHRLQKDKEISLQKHEQILLKGLFGEETESRRLSDIRDFYTTLNEVKDNIFQDLTERKFFIKNPDKVWKLYMAAGAAIIIVSAPIYVIFFAFLGLTGIFGIVMSGLILMAFSTIMPAKTRLGADMLGYIRGLKEYIKTAEEDRIKFEEKTDQRATFEHLLPYALAFGVATKWAKAFQNIYTTPPEWYGGYYGQQFMIMHFMDSLTSATGRMERSFTPRTASTSGGSGFGGGFSGGGFGGGGGSGW